MESVQQTVASPPNQPPPKEPYWPFKNHDLLRTGSSNLETGSFNLDKPAWEFREPERELKGHPINVSTKVFHSSPIIDADRNVYIVSTTGWMYSLSPEGKLRWEFELAGGDPGNPALVNGVLFTACRTGWAYAIDAKTGKERWSKRIAEFAPGDTWSAVGLGDDIILPATPADWRRAAHIADMVHPNCGGEEVVCVSASTGEVKWRYQMTHKFGVILYNVMPAIVENSVVVSDASGGVHRVHLETGALLWYSKGVAGTWSTGGMVVGPNNVVYVAHSREAREHDCNGKGRFRALDLKTGIVQWEKDFETPLNAAPAVGMLNGKLSVVVNAGMNREPPPFDPNKKFLIMAKPEFPNDKSTVVIFDAASGDCLLNYEVMENYGISGKERTPSDSWCFPDLFGTPAIGSDNTIYINWSGGKTFSLHVDSLGKIDVVRSFTHGYGVNGESAIAPGLLVVPSCEALYAFPTMVPEQAGQAAPQ